jgi:hypothetical protein
MEKVHMNAVEERNLRRWAYVLLVLAWLGIAWIVLVLAKAALGIDFRVGFAAKEGIKIFAVDDFTVSQRLVLVGISAVPYCCWLYSMWQVVRMSMGFSRAEILTQRTVAFLEHFGWGMLVLAISESFFISSIGEYLVSIGKIGAVENHWKYVLDSGFQISLMAALLIMIVSRILRIGIRLREDVELTI